MANVSEILLQVRRESRHRVVLKRLLTQKSVLLRSLKQTHVVEFPQAKLAVVLELVQALVSLVLAQALVSLALVQDVLATRCLCLM